INVRCTVSGQSAILSCRTQNKSVIVVEWSRPDLKNKHVLFYRDEQFDTDSQHPSFKQRVALKDRQMKDGDVSLILKYVTINDTGTYQCRVFIRGTNRRKRAILETEPICIIKLSVSDPSGESLEFIWLCFLGCLLLVFIYLCIYYWHRKNTWALFQE
uniref:Ig-like domain-containing protein n=1 Tax=Oreochromis aureus TaxID=47969 RepID=A0A668SWJ9_OREAU